MKKTALFILVLALFHVKQLYPETYQYLIYMNKISLTDYNTIKSKGLKTNSQPSRITNVISPKNTNYVLLNITPQGISEINILDDLGVAQKVEIISKTTIDNVYNSRIGGYETQINKTVYNELPADFYEVAKSTP